MARRSRLLAVAVVLLASCSGGGGQPSSLGAPPVSPPPDPPPERSCPPPAASFDPAPPASTLVLYDDDAPWEWLGESYGIAAGNLASHFGPWQGRPVARYEPGDMHAFSAVVYVGSFFDAPLPRAFLDDVLAGGTPVVWLGFNVWRLEDRDPAFAARYGFTTGDLDYGAFSTVRYRGRELTRSLFNSDGILALYAAGVFDPQILATVVRDADGSELPWALRSGDLTYVAENPISYMSESDRYLAFADLLFDALAPATPERHRALVRIEDVTPAEDPDRLRAIADLLHALCVPFSVAVVPVWRDPLGAYASDGLPRRLRLRDSEVADALAYMVSRGGELVLHGYTHQFGATIDPYTGASADDFEFWMTYVDEHNRVIYVDPDGVGSYAGPVPGDSESYARDRVQAGLEELAAAGLPPPIAFEYPHYAGSAIDSFAIRPLLPTAYHRGFYFPGTLSGTGEDLARPFGQLFPYVVTDVYGWRVIPETLGNYEPEPGNAGIPPRFVPDLLRNADANYVVRDGFASFFFHPYFEPEILASIVTGIQGLGYEFVSAGSL
jgi:uncharacterized protein YdaL